MPRYALVAATLCILSLGAPALAVTAKDKMATCLFGANDQNLQGAARTAFIKKCMANKNDPRGPGPAPVSGSVPPPPPPQR